MPARSHPVAQFANIRTNGLIAITLREDDDLISVHLTDGTKEIIIGTREGMLVRFKEDSPQAVIRFDFPAIC